MNLQAGQSRREEVIVISDDEADAVRPRALNGLVADANDDWEDDNDEHMDGFEDLDDLDEFDEMNHFADMLASQRVPRTGDFPVQKHNTGGFGGNTVAEPFPPFVPQPTNAHTHAYSGSEAREEHPHPTRDECVAQVYGIFPDICPQYLENLCAERGNRGEAAIAAICENMEQGKPYPKRAKLLSLKRKREPTAAEEAQKMYGASDREDEISGMYYTTVREILSSEFKNTPKHFIDSVLRAKPTRHLFQAYKVLEEAERTLRESNLEPYRAIRTAREMAIKWSRLRLEHTIADLKKSPHRQDELRAAEELLAARRVRQEADDRRTAEKLAEEEECLNTKIAEEEGMMKECGCCFGDYPLNRMVHCNSDGDMHWFCRNCANRTAEEVIGNSKYEITCMSTDGCSANFSRDQMLQFLDEKSFIALDRNEQEAVLRIAGIENLASCPFCPYAAEYPPIEEDKEFRCEAPECEKVSCRLCKLETHIPKSCEENAKENGLSVRRQIEEAMTAALIRTCNKCGTPFVKDVGCNKMTCTRNGCGNVQCYVCSESCSYNHFNDPNRGGQKGNCPLFESVEERHEEEVKKAEDEAIRKVRADHPEYSENELRVQVSENVKKDDEKRKAMNPGPVHRHMDMFGLPPRPGGDVLGGDPRALPNDPGQYDGGFLQQVFRARGEAVAAAGAAVGPAQAQAQVQAQAQARARLQDQGMQMMQLAEMQQRVEQMRNQQLVHQQQQQNRLQARQAARAKAVRHVDQIGHYEDLLNLVNPLGNNPAAPAVRQQALGNENLQAAGNIRPDPAHQQAPPYRPRFEVPDVGARFLARFDDRLRRRQPGEEADVPRNGVNRPSPRQLLQRMAGNRAQHANNAQAVRQPVAPQQLLVPAAVPVQQVQPRAQGPGRFMRLAANVANLVGRRNAPQVAPAPAYPMSPRERAGRRATIVDLAPPRTPDDNMDLDGLLASPDPGPRRKRRSQF